MSRQRALLALRVVLCLLSATSAAQAPASTSPPGPPSRQVAGSWLARWESWSYFERSRRTDRATAACRSSQNVRLLTAFIVIASLELHDDAALHVVMPQPAILVADDQVAGSGEDGRPGGLMADGDTPTADRHPARRKSQDL